MRYVYDEGDLDNWLSRQFMDSRGNVYNMELDPDDTPENFYSLGNSNYYEIPDSGWLLKGGPI